MVLKIPADPMIALANRYPAFIKVRMVKCTA
jgi:hypothetical protein